MQYVLKHLEQLLAVLVLLRNIFTKWGFLLYYMEDKELLIERFFL